MICKLKARVNIHGVLNVESGYYVEDQEVEEEIKEEEKKDPDVSDEPNLFSRSALGHGPSLEGAAQDSASKRRRLKSPDKSAGDRADVDPLFPRLDPVKLTKEPQAMDTDTAKEPSKPKTRKVKKQVRKGELPVVAGTNSLDTPARNALTEKEAAMVMEDKLVADTEEKKNELETYIYDMRNKLDDQYADFASEDEKDKIRSKLTDTEVSSRLGCFYHGRVAFY
jgi:heat shock 70kDa protein 4